jgi:uncharacterized protein YecT (DUF1311 family)
MKKMTFSMLAVLSLLLMLAVSPARAQKQKDPCANAQTQMELNDCQAREYKRADAALNTAYKQLMAKVEDAGERNALKASQLAWIKYRDANCEFESYLNKGGTMYSMVYDGCLTALTEERTRHLRDLLNNR